MDVEQEKVTENKPQIFIGRQPIFDSKLKIAGYELLFRSGEGNAYDGCDGDKATSHVINNALMEIGLDEVVADVPAYINFTRELIINGVAQLLPADRVVLEILETVKVDQELIDEVEVLVKAGYQIALDDFTYSDEWQPLIKLAHIVKIDVMEHPIDKIREQLKPFEGRKVKLLAEKVETQDEYDQLKAEGFDYFQGYFFSKPVVISHKAMSADNISLIQLIAQLQNPDAEIDEIEKLVSQNISLSYKLLRYINSAAFALENKLASIKQIVVYFGIQRLKNWVCLIALAGNNNKPAELILTGLIRAKMCELIANETDVVEKESYFVVGLFSILDALLDQPLPTILENLPLDDSINKALLELEGDMGKALSCSISCEQCVWDKIEFSNISMARLSDMHMEATVWSRQSMSELN
jgi:c-di-GMP-related signal transduction protein